jgi:hypothetical protein
MHSKFSWSFREVRRQNTCQYLLNRAETLKGIGDYPASIADLTALIKSYGTEKIVIPIERRGQLLGLQSGSGNSAPRHHFRTEQTVAPGHSRLHGSSRRETRRQPGRPYGNLGYGAPPCWRGKHFRDRSGYRKAEVDAERIRLLNPHEQMFNAGIAKTFEWVHYRRGLYAFGRRTTPRPLPTRRRN